eukprot:COSAG04_NODE_1904_length_5259_cov_176.869767_3_plen_623_part_00
MVYPATFAATGATSAPEAAAAAEAAAAPIADSAMAAAKSEHAVEAAAGVLAAAARRLARGFAPSSERLVAAWLQAECACAPAGRGGCFGWRIESLPRPSTGGVGAGEGSEAALTSACRSAMADGGQAARETLAATFRAAGADAVQRVLGALYEEVARQQLGIRHFTEVLDCVSEERRTVFENCTLRKACAAQRSPIESEDYERLASQPYCEVCRSMGDQVTPCAGCGVAAYCCAAHAEEDAGRHGVWCKTLLLSRLLWQCAVPPEQYDRLRRTPPSSSGVFRCRGRPRAADDAPAHLAGSFWEDGWSGYFKTPREQDKEEEEGRAEEEGQRLARVLSTDSLSTVMTVRYTLARLGLDSAPALTLYLLGAVFEESQPWEELLAWLPETHSLTLVLTGPDVKERPSSSSTPQGLRNAAGQPVQIHLHFLPGLFHWLSAEQRGRVPAADVAFAFHSGMPEYASWPPTLRQLLQPGARPAPLVVTAWTAPEALKARSMMLEAGGEPHPALALCGNPWASLVPQRTIDHHGTANFNNRYILAMRPGDGAPKRPSSGEAPEQEPPPKRAREGPGAPADGDVRRRIEAVYEAHNPAKLGSVGALVAKYGAERLLAMVTRKYCSAGAAGT